MEQKIKKELEVLKIELNELRKNSTTNQNEIRIKLNQMGQRYQKFQKYNEALDCMKECLDIEKQILPSNHKDIASSLYLIGNIYDDLEQLEKALKYLNESLEISKLIFRSNHPSIASTLVSFGIVYQKQGKLEEALKCFNQSIEIFKQNYQENHPSIADTLINVAYAYKKNGQFEVALKYYKQSLEMRKKILPENDVSIADTLNKIGVFYKDQRNFQESLKYLNQSLEIYMEKFPENPSSIADVLKNIGTVYIYQDQSEEALKYYKQSLEMRKKSFFENDILTAETLNNIGGIYRNQGKLEEGLKYFNQSLELYKKVLPSTHFYIGETIHNIGIIYFDKRNYEEALKYCNQGREIMEKNLPESNHSLEVSRNFIGLIYYNQGKYEEALKYLKDAQTKEECLKKLEDKRKQVSHSMENISITDQESKIDYLLNDLKIRKVKSQISKVSITLQTYIEGINADVLIGRVIDGKYKIDKYLGRGAYGKVYTVLDILESNNIKVIKLIKKHNDDDEWATEASLLRRLEHNNIVKYYDHFDLISKESKSYPCIITEYCENGDLASKIEKTKNRRENFQDKIISNWIFQASDGLQYLHIMTVIHRDIKPQNILLTRDDVIKLADLGTAKVMQEYIVTNTVIGTPIYMSPEMQACRTLMTGPDYSYPTDIWSLGCVLYELVFLDYAHRNIGKDHPSGGSANFSGYIKKMLAQNPDDRITAQNLYEEFKKLKERLDR